MLDNELIDLVPICDQRLRILEFDFDVAEFQNVQTLDALPAKPKVARSYLAVFVGDDAPMHIDPITVRILQLCDGTRRAVDVIEGLCKDASTPVAVSERLGWIEQLLVRGLIGLRQNTGAGASLARLKPKIA